jgi:hypothetical protein
MELTREQQLALDLARARASTRAAEAQADCRSWEKFKSKDEDIKPWELAKKQQEEAELKPWSGPSVNRKSSLLGRGQEHGLAQPRSKLPKASRGSGSGISARPNPAKRLSRPNSRTDWPS